MPTTEVKYMSESQFVNKHAKGGDIETDELFKALQDEITDCETWERAEELEREIWAMSIEAQAQHGLASRRRAEIMQTSFLTAPMTDVLDFQTEEKRWQVIYELLCLAWSAAGKRMRELKEG